jgi:hypothetical protein
MFSGCSALNYIRCAATSISATDCTTGWVSGVTATGTFYVPATTQTAWQAKADGNGKPANFTIMTY